MKKIVTILSLAFALVSISAMAQKPPTQEAPISGRDVLREYALGQGVRGFRDAVADSIQWDVNSDRRYIEATGVSTEEVLSKLFSEALIYTLANTEDSIRGRVWIYDSQDQLLFFGSSTYKITDLGKSGPVYSIWMQDVHLFTSVQSAEVLVLGEDGETANRIWLEVQDGRVRFMPHLAGAPNGILVVKYKDGSIMTYQLASPVGQSPAQTKEGLPSWKIEGHYVFNFSENQKGGAPAPVLKIIEPWLRPTALITVDAEQTITFDVVGLVQQDEATSFERPTEIIFNQVDGPWSAISPGSINGGPVVLTLPSAGTHRVRFNWKNFGRPTHLYTGPRDDHEGAKGL